MKRLFLCLFLMTTAFAKESKGATLLEETSSAFTQIAEKAMPATVFLKVKLAPEERSTPFDDEDDFFRHFFGRPFQQPPRREAEPQMSGGSGFLIHSNGYIVTNHHVVQNAKEITVILNDGKQLPGVVKGVDPRSDLALVKIEETNLPYLSFGSSDDLKIGEWVVAIGNPFGLEATLTVGVVSAKGRQDIGLTSYEDFIQTDAAINPGNSGGPLLNLKGEVIGVNTAIFSRSGGYMGIGFSIPSKMAEYVIAQLEEKGNVQRGYLGIVLQPIDKDLADAQGMNTQEGVLISEVMKDSPADKAGLQQGDIILSYNNKKVKSPSQLRNDIGMMAPDTRIELKILRGKKSQTISLFLGAQSNGEALSAEMIQKLGIEIETLTPEMGGKLGVPSHVEGVVIGKVKPGSPAAIAGLRPGFVITGVGLTLNEQQRVKNTADFEKALEKIGDKKHLIVIVRHQNVQRYYTIKLG